MAMSIEQSLVMTVPQNPAEWTHLPYVGERMEFSGMILSEGNRGNPSEVAGLWHQVEVESRCKDDGHVMLKLRFLEHPKGVPQWEKWSQDSTRFAPLGTHTRSSSTGARAPGAGSGRQLLGSAGLGGVGEAPSMVSNAPPRTPGGEFWKASKGVFRKARKGPPNEITVPKSQQAHAGGDVTSVGKAPSATVPAGVAAGRAAADRAEAAVSEGEGWNGSSSVVGSASYDERATGDGAGVPGRSDDRFSVARPPHTVPIPSPAAASPRSSRSPPQLSPLHASVVANLATSMATTKSPATSPLPSPSRFSSSSSFPPPLPAAQVPEGVSPVGVLTQHRSVFLSSGPSTTTATAAAANATTTTTITTTTDIPASSENMTLDVVPALAAELDHRGAESAAEAAGAEDVGVDDGRSVKKFWKSKKLRRAGLQSFMADYTARRRGSSSDNISPQRTPLLTVSPVGGASVESREEGSMSETRPGSSASSSALFSSPSVVSEDQGFGAISGGDGMAAAAAAVAMLQPTRELTPHIIEEDAEGHFGVTVFRQNKKDEVASSIIVGKFDTYEEAARAGECFSSPVWQEYNSNSRCAVCSSTFRGLRRKHHCRNCGRLVCGNCSRASWRPTMLPHTYRVDKSEITVRVCGPCHESNERFRWALLSGDEEEAMAAYETGCVNLRVPYKVYQGEFPVHCAAAGGNVQLLSWLLEDRCCPIYLDQEKTMGVRDSWQRTVMGAAAASGQAEVLRYLVLTQGCGVQTLEHIEELWSALEACLLTDDDDESQNDGENGPCEGHQQQQQQHTSSSRGAGNCYITDQLPQRPRPSKGAHGVTGSSTDGSDTAATYCSYDMPRSLTRGESDGGSSAPGLADNACLVCWSKTVDCTLVPCGHRLCCMDCSETLINCSICSATIKQRIRTINV